MNITILNPADQPSGKYRILQWFENCFDNPSYDHCRLVSAFARVRPFYKLESQVSSWKSTGKTIEAIFGIDLQGTSRQALEYALSTFDKTFVVNARDSTFHPKMYMFFGKSEATIYYGSSNFTVGGLETNFEGGIILDFNIQTNQDAFMQAENIFLSLLPKNLSCSKELTHNVLMQLQNSNVLLDESLRKIGKERIQAVSKALESAGDDILSKTFDSYKTYPAKPIPKEVMNSKNASTHGTKSLVNALTSGAPIVSGLIIQIAPHKNGEIHLSKIAINQNPSFFGFPFSGKTIPKKATNTPYPQRTPDPVVNIEVYDDRGALAHIEHLYKLNTIFYTKKSEIRITITPHILKALEYEGDENYPILVISESSDSSYDYDMAFYAHGSSNYSTLIGMCNQELPSGGKPVSRKMGWF